MPLEKLLPYQEVGSKWLSTMTHALLADEMGLGKTCQGVRGSDMVGANDILVICPSSVCINWVREFQRFSPMDRPCKIVATAKAKIPTGGVVICSYDMAVAHEQELGSRIWDVLILDEAHYLKNRSADRTWTVYGRGGVAPGIASAAKRVWRLTGTPAPNDARELYPHLVSARLVKPMYWDYVDRYCVGFETKHGYKVTAHKNVDELKALLKQFMLRRTKAEVAPDMPELWFQHVTIGGELLKKTQAADEELRKELEAAGTDDEIIAVLRSKEAGSSTLRRHTGLAKVKEVAAILADELTSRALEKVVIFCHHQEVVEGIHRALADFGAVRVTGSTPRAQRQVLVDLFAGNPGYRVFVGNIQAAGVGIDGLQVSCSEVVLLEQSWVPGENAQAVMRVHRYGQKKSVRARVFSLFNSTDETVNQALVRKANELAKISC